MVTGARFATYRLSLAPYQGTSANARALDYYKVSIGSVYSHQTQVTKHRSQQDSCALRLATSVLLLRVADQNSSLLSKQAWLKSRQNCHCRQTTAC